ncbi:2,4-dihydroxyhept-2-enedioate aldolase [Noviherbaspirillum humi]|uniref:2,4-dihydroxyhept-2-enedioate aldolase n=1 Tax=Noviherbaspirillum humi TaxID=1688639 RepID=A0A239G7X7_9BURK|nr:aldolase/citrate lyase family protein [Noviherbaspirillum humi]SNS64563.1 2,4-dihydroxyhept-2-enedioate aldolase [Noviherbaspirillum humi]
MELPKNGFKQALQEGRQQVGLWCTLSHPYGLELLAGSGFDWLLIDTEHSPSDLANVLAQLQAVAPYPVAPVVRPAWNDPVVIKRYLDIGAQTLLIPYVQNADEARQAVRSVRYAPGGMRGVSALTRASRFGRIPDYAKACERELCLLVQVETVAAVDRIEEIAEVEGVDGIFIGPGDLAADMGFVGEQGNPAVKAKVEEAIARITKCGKPAGILTGDEAFAKRCIELGTLFTAVGVDAGILARQSMELRKRFD